MSVKIRHFFNSQKTCSCSMTGVWRAVACMSGVVVIFHSPRACTHIGRTMDMGSYYRGFADGHPEKMRSIPLLCSQLEEKQAIFGGAEKLRECINFAAKQYKSSCKCLVVANSCVSGVIGDDVEAVVEEAEEELGIPVLTVDCYGFLGSEFYDGYIKMTNKLVERFLKPQEHIPHTAIVLGDNGGPWNERNLEVVRILEGLGLKILGQFPSYMALDELQRVTQAEVSVIVGGYGRNLEDMTELAKTLEERFGVRSLGAIPGSLEKTIVWLRNRAKEFACEERVEGFIEAEEQRFAAKVTKFQTRTAGKKTVLCLGRSLRYYHPSYILEVIKLLKLDLLGIAFLEGTSAKNESEVKEILENLTEVPIVKAEEAEKLLQRADIVITTSELKADYRQVYVPLVGSSGAWGQLNFMNAIYNVLRSCKLGGGITYVR